MIGYPRKPGLINLHFFTVSRPPPDPVLPLLSTNTQKPRLENSRGLLPSLAHTPLPELPSRQHKHAEDRHAVETLGSNMALVSAWYHDHGSSAEHFTGSVK